MIKFKINFLTILVLFALNIGYSQSKYGSTIFNVIHDPSSEAVGSAVVAENTGVFSLLWNPAGLSNCENISFGFVHSKVFISDISYNFLGGTYKYHNHNLGLAIVRLGIDNIKDSRYAIKNGTIYYPAIKYFNVADYLIILGIAPQQNYSRLKYGINLKYLYKSYQIENASGFGVDAGILYDVFSGLTAGAKISNVFGSMILWSTSKKEWVKPELSYGLKYERNIYKKLNAVAYLNAFHFFDNRRESAASNIGFVSNELSIGAKLKYLNKLSISIGRDQLGNFTYGAGIKIPHIDLNYSNVNHPELGNIQNVGIVVNTPF